MHAAVYALVVIMAIRCASSAIVELQAKNIVGALATVLIAAASVVFALGLFS